MTHMSVTPAIGTVLVWRDRSDQYSGQNDPLTLVLHQQGYSVVAVEEEKKVLETVLKSDLDLLVIYLQTSGEQGYEFCKMLRQLSCLNTFPIVFVGIRDQSSELIKALRCGGSEYLQLPIEAEECWLRLERYLKTRQMVRALEADKAHLHQQMSSYNQLLQQQEAAQISLAQENQALQRMAFVDGLTQVANRRSFNQKIPQLWQAAKVGNQPISLLLCDIDYFKRYNDTYGHLGGDGCLQAVAKALVKGTHRHSDHVARYGGEEFAILLPATDSYGAQRVALSVQSALSQAQLPHTSSPVKPFVSLSIGICTLEPARYPASYSSNRAHNGAQEECEVLIYGADEALYTAKLRGRDRAVVNSSNGLITVLPNRPQHNGSASCPQMMPTKQPVNKSPQMRLRLPSIAN
ncbi:MAG: diguanylate cyclase [Phormidesmis sp.]